MLKYKEKWTKATSTGKNTTNNKFLYIKKQKQKHTHIEFI